MSKKVVTYLDFTIAHQDFETDNRRHSYGLSKQVWLDEWSQSNLANMDDEGLWRLSADDWQQPFKGRIAAEIARRERARQSQVLKVSIATLLVALAGLAATVLSLL